ncbi:MAG: LysR family transcriptional regulator [Kordiimonadaceae bacterium]|nr:LysR family transcriptional regulator [Kordiimonadaceae bacterium]
MNWDDLRIFLAVAEAPSMRVAAKNLKISHSTVSRRVEALEREMDVKLFDRTTDGYRLTRSGDELLPVATSMQEQLFSFNRNVAGRDAELKGRVCVAVLDLLAISLLMPHFRDFMEAYPNIKLTVLDGMAPLDLSKRQADVAFRYTNRPPEHLIGTKLGVDHQAAYATRDYLEKHNPNKPDSDAKWVAWGRPEGKPSWIARSPFPQLETAGYFNHMLIQHQAVREGLGIGYFACIVGDKDPELVRISEPEPTYCLWLLSHRDLRATARMRAFRQFIIKRQPQIEAALAGRSLETDL